ncbi:MAG TPA: DUF429 domain-containing protein, partial [Chloroflexota bacterium]|nr:DUF429 domain-containing protein [Chloroflexota bacterium]
SSRVDRTGETGLVAEVYPAAALAEWCQLHGGSYKTGDGAKDRRKEIGAWLASQLGEGFRLSKLTITATKAPELGEELRLEDLQGGRSVETDHVIDATIAAICGWATVVGLTHRPPAGDGHLQDFCDSEQHRRHQAGFELEGTLEEVIAREGWIRHPLASPTLILERRPSLESRSA